MFTGDMLLLHLCFFFFKQKTAYEMRISDWSSDVCSSDLFTLWAKAEFTEDEYALLQKYRFNDALLIADDWLAMLQRSFRTAVMLGFVAWWLLFAFFSWSVSTSLAVLLVLILTAVYYHDLREHIFVRDLAPGRPFRCFSIVELVQKEEYPKGIPAYPRQVLETRKPWDGREVV